MISDALITAAAADLVSSQLTAAAQLQLLTYIRQTERYRKSPGLYPDLAEKLATATGFNAQFLQAVLNSAKAVGTQATQLSQFSSLKVGSIALGIKDGASVDAYDIFNDALSFLYDVPAQRPSSAVVRMTDSAICVIHLRDRSYCGCSAVLVF